MTDPDAREEQGAPPSEATDPADGSGVDDRPDRQSPGRKADDDELYSEAQAAVRDVQEEEERDGG